MKKKCGEKLDVNNKKVTEKEKI